MTTPKRKRCVWRERRENKFCVDAGCGAVSWPWYSVTGWRFCPYCGLRIVRLK